MNTFMPVLWLVTTAILVYAVMNNLLNTPLITVILVVNTVAFIWGIGQFVLWLKQCFKRIKSSKIINSP